jgi:hypothetical protein
MTKPAGRGEPGGGDGQARNLWRLVMRGEEAGMSAQAADRGALGSLHGRVRRFLGFGVMRASVPLRTVIRSGEPIHARARLESARIEERYCYRQQISLNPSFGVRREPDGQIKLVLPYDGEKYFTRQAYRDVVRARRHGADRDADGLIGFLALTNYEHTDLGSVLSLEESHGSFPVQVRLPVAPGPHGTDPLLADDSACVVSHNYQPYCHMGQPAPVYLDIQLDDPDTAEIPWPLESVTDELSSSMARQVDFKPGLSLSIRVRLTMPRELADGAHPTVSEVFIDWPTRTSLRSLRLDVAGQPHQLRYNPERPGRGRLEWRGVPMNADPKPAGGDIRFFSSPPMTLAIPKPGDLYRQESLHGHVEVTVDRLLSGMDARLFDATGKLCQRGPERVSVVSTKFSLTLDDAFARRVRSPRQQMHFDEVILTRARIDDIVTALRNRGFTVTSLDGRDVTADPPRKAAASGNRWLRAERVHGPDTLSMILYVTGNRYRTQRKRQVKGGMTYHTTVNSGDLQLYAYGRLRRDSKTVVQEMNALRRALRERFDRLPARR